MKKTFNSLLVLLVLLTFFLVSSCGKDVSETTTEVKLFSAATSIINLQAAVIVAVRATDGRKMSFIANPSGLVMPVPNGDWKFYAYGWESSPYTGQARCAFGGYTTVPTVPEVINLTGLATSINMNFTAANCAFGSSYNIFHQGSAFVESGTFSRLRVYFCGEDVTGSTMTACPATQPVIGSYMQVRFSGFANLDGFPLIKEEFSLKSACTQIVAGFNDTAFVIPPGNPIIPELPFGLIIEVFSTAGCAGAPSKAIFLENGLAKAAIDHPTLINLQHHTPSMDLFLNYPNLPY